MTLNKWKQLFLSAFLLVLLIIALPALSQAEQETKQAVHYAREVDLSGIAEKGGRLVGTIQTFRPKAEPRVLYVDCPIPAEIAPEQAAVLTVEYKTFDKKSLAAALLATGTDSGKGKLTVVNEGWDARAAIYQQEALLDIFFEGYVSHELLASKPDAFHEKRSEMDFAAKQAMAFVKALGFAPCEGSVHTARLYDPDGFALFSARSDRPLLMEEANRDYLRRHKKYGRTDFDYTVVRLGVLLNGLPAAPEFTWPEGSRREPDAIVGNSSDARLLIRDDGTVTEARLTNMPVVVSSVPMDMPPHSWQDALREYIASYFVSRTNPRDVQRTDSKFERDYTEYATYSVLTEIKPIYMSREKRTYIPAWCFVVEKRLAKNNTTVSFSMEYLDAATLDSPTMLAFR